MPHRLLPASTLDNFRLSLPADIGVRAGPVRLAHDQKYVKVSALEPPLVLRSACHYSYAIDTLLDCTSFSAIMFEQNNNFQTLEIGFS